MKTYANLVRFEFTLSNGVAVVGEVELEWERGPLDVKPLAMDWDVTFGGRLRAVGPIEVYRVLTFDRIREEFYRRVAHFSLENTGT